MSLSFSFLRPLHEDSSWVRQSLIGGLILALCPPLGWMLAMGYRQCFGISYVSEFTRSRSIQWPRLESGSIGALLLRGLKVWGVIWLYLLPSWALLWSILLRRAGAGEEQLSAMLRWGAECFVLLPIGFPRGLWRLSQESAWFHVTPLEGALCALLFGIGAFFIPAGFVQVVTGRGMRAAFPFGPGWRLVAARPREYTLAWAKALTCCLGPFVLLAPALWLGRVWLVVVYLPISVGVFWSYVASVKIFSDVYLGMNRRACGE